MLRALTGVFAAILRRANRERRSDRVVWAELLDVAGPHGGWVAFPAHHSVCLLESKGGRVEEIALVQEAEMKVSVRGEPTVRMTFTDGTAEVCRFGGWGRRPALACSSARPRRT